MADDHTAKNYTHSPTFAQLGQDVTYNCIANHFINEPTKQNSFTAECLAGFTYDYQPPVLDCVERTTCAIAGLPTITDSEMHTHVPGTTTHILDTETAV